MKKRLLTLSICFALIVTMFSIASVSVSAFNGVNRLEIANVVEPYAGQNPSYGYDIIFYEEEIGGAYDYIPAGFEDYFIRGLGWYSVDGGYYMDPNEDTFSLDCTYRLEMYLNASGTDDSDDFHFSYNPLDQYDGVAYVNNHEVEATLLPGTNHKIIKLTYEFVAKEPKLLSDCSFQGMHSVTYEIGCSIYLFPTVKDGSNKLERGIDYYLDFGSNDKVGKGKVYVYGMGKYYGKKILYFNINPRPTYITSLTRYRKAFKVKWAKRTTQTSGYQIRYSTSSKFTSYKTSTVTKTSTTYKTIKKLKANKYYYVKVRTYKTVNGVKYYSNWSKVKKVKTK